MPEHHRSHGGALATRFWTTIDSEGVALFQVVFYLTFIVIGLHDLFIAHSGPLTLHGSMSYLNIQQWCWANIIGPGCCLLGKLMAWYGSPGGAARSGQWLQLFGDIAISFALLAYMIATFHVEPWGTGGYGGYLSLATWLSTVLLTVRDGRRLAGKPVRA